MTPDNYCQEKAASSGSSFYYSFLFLPEQKRKAIIALYAFCREVDDVVDAQTEVHIKQTKLHWWRNEIQALFDGHPQHPVTRALQAVIQDFNLPQEQFEEIIDGMEMDLLQNRYDSFKDLSLYCHRVASVVGLLSIEIFGYQDRQTRKFAHDLGMAFQLTNIVRDVYEDSTRNRIYLPQDELAEFNVDDKTILQHQNNEAFVALIKFQIKRARDYYDKALSEIPDVDRYAQRAALAMARIYLETLNEIETDGCRVLEHRIKLTPIRKVWLTWKTLRQEKRRYKKWLRQNPK
ncbi:MAG: presqualene diphosphate synthase HpnD [Gammaproteobacteria bacterium]|nr:presqualene diphosphate synthase HpnD [Gammaproteobacteria bacterium]